MVYQKYRTTYEIPGIPDVELVLDELPYGVFIEIEGKPAAIEASLERLEMTTANRITASYIQIFETVRREHNLSIVNLTFEDFAGITLDPTVFERC